jgi:SAM-dependent methyltransferase
MLDFVRGGGLKSRLLNPVEEMWDRRLGVRTFGFLGMVGEPGARDWRAHYVPVRYKRLFAALRHVGLGADDVFVDLGCGLGRTVFAASWLGARRSLGVEIDPGLVQQARRNLAAGRLAGRDIEFICQPAQEFTPAGVTVLFMFHPFGAGTMEQVVQQLDAELDRAPRRLRVVYENPIHAAVLEASRHLRPTGRWKPGEQGSGYECAFLEARA